LHRKNHQEEAGCRLLRLPEEPRSWFDTLTIPSEVEGKTPGIGQRPARPPLSNPQPSDLKENDMKKIIYLLALFVFLPYSA